MYNDFIIVGRPKERGLLGIKLAACTYAKKAFAMMVDIKITLF